jgi:acyl-CoA reductase-like NAD-dependent aldehyde dehydrogenase
LFLGRIINETHTKRLLALLEPTPGVPPFDILTGGAEYSIVKEKYIPPTILNNVLPQHTIMQDEIFGKKKL